ncbi:hypothetical protein FQR65_LT04347 [Abscondita terminalis]|nr:hypothetical protein FQR65_LT04347 [Abscondita terminalis]
MNKVKKGKKVSVWTKENLTTFLENFEGFPCLYDPKNSFYSNKHARADALHKLKAALEPMEVTVEEVKSKINNIRTQISHELKKLKENHSGMEREELYEPVWWFDLAQFLIPHVKPRKGVDNLGNDESEKDTENINEETPESFMDDATNDDLVTPTSSSASHKRATTPVGRKAKRQNSGADSLDTYSKTVETLQVLNENIIRATGRPPNKEIEFANFIAKELGEIGDPEILLDAKHEISNVIFNYKKKWLRNHAEITFEVINSDNS